LFSKIENLLTGGPIRRDAFQIYVIQGLTLGLALVGSIIVARTLGPAKKGIFDLFNLLSSFITDFGLLGFGSGLLYYLANKGRPLGEVHGTGFIFSIIAGIPTVLIGWLGLRFWMKIFPGLDVWIILLPFLLSVVAYYRLIWSNIMTGINKAVTTYRVGFYFTIFNVAAICALWKLSFLDVKRVIGLTVLLAILNGVFAFLVLFKEEPKLRLSVPLAKESLRYGLVIYAGFVANVIHFKIDQVMINYMLGTEAVGIYAVSVRWAEMLFILDNAIISASLYRISSSSTQESFDLTKRLFKIQLLISGGTGIVLSIAAYPIVTKLYGEPYRGAVWPLILLIPGVVSWSVSKIISGMLTYKKGLSPYVAKVAILGALLNVFLNYISIKIIGMGIIGASISSSLSYMFVAIFVHFKAKGIMRDNYGSE
jgi:O-antigen/teichoic acid export membrane protein